jgi:LuxR family maltose regulon positive regulatory protein
MISRGGLYERLGARAVTLISAPAGSGKTVLLRSWIAEARRRHRVAWVSVERDEVAAQSFWLSVVRELRAALAADEGVEELVPTTSFDGQAIVDRLVSELGSLSEPVTLVIDDLHELRSPEALAQLEMLLARRPPLLEVVLATRRDPQLRLHRLRLAGELTELRAPELRFTLEETRELLDASGVALSDDAVALLHSRAEGWAAGLRLAALSLANHADPEQFVAEFCGCERAVADYLLTEVLERQPDEVQRLLLRTSVLGRLNGALADALVGARGSERILHALEDANAFVMSLDPGRSWFRYHRLFADVLGLELRRSEPHLVRELHRTASEWFAEHGYPVEAVRHAQAAEDWAYAARVLVDHSFSFMVGGQAATMVALLASFPTEARTDPDLAVVSSYDLFVRGALEEASAYLSVAERHLASVSDERRQSFEVAVAFVRLSIAVSRGDVSAALEGLQSLRASLDAPAPTNAALGDDAEAVAVMNLGIIELWSSGAKDAERHLEHGVELARRSGRAYVEVGCLAHLAVVAAALHSFARARETSQRAIALAETNGWACDPVVGIACAVLGGILVWQGRLDEAEHWLGRAERAILPGAQPHAEVLRHLAQGMLHAGHGRHQDALVSYRAAEQVQTRLAEPLKLAVYSRPLVLQAMLRLGETMRVEHALAAMDDELRESAEVCTAIAALRLARDDPEGAVAVLAAVIDGSVRSGHPVWLVEALLLESIARDALGDAGASGRSLERALELAEPDGVLWPFLVHPAPALLERHQRHRTTHASLISEILGLQAGKTPVSRRGEPEPPVEPLSECETRVLRYLPTNLSGPEIASELYLAASTVKTHIQHIYAKLGVHRRAAAVERARALGLLAPSFARASLAEGPPASPRAMRVWRARSPNDDDDGSTQHDGA